MATTKSNSKSVALGKRSKIDSAQRNMLIFVGAASVILGITIVAVIYFAKTISFNKKLIAAKDEVIASYKSTQKNLNDISNKISGLSTNENLESVGRMRDSICEGYDGKGLDVSYSLEQLPNVRKCSALRVITDALPYTKNQDSAVTSFYILIMLAKDGALIDGLRPNDFDKSTIDDVTFNTMKINVDFKATQEKILNTLNSIEKSIRNFNVSRASLSYGRGDNAGSDISFSASYLSYSSDKAGLVQVKKVVCAKADNDKCRQAGGDGKEIVY
ncbi:hypothetical protein IJM16_04450 [Candidatus Saccharibacteria bacterium]|nr:hypothetical protein [Candidatus Saccharibacteria bacterium]